MKHLKKKKFLKIYINGSTFINFERFFQKSRYEYNFKNYFKIADFIKVKK